MSDVPWINGPQQDPLRNLVSGNPTKPSPVPSMAERAAYLAGQNQNAPVPNSTDQTAQLFGSLISEIKTIGETLNNSIDTKFLSQGSVMLVCIDKNVKADTNSSEVPTMLVASPNVDIKVVSYQEYENKEQLKIILQKYQALIDAFKQANQNEKKAAYFIFLGRLIEGISFNGLEYKI